MNNTNSQRRSLFITFEGGEGAGKTTLINKLEKVLANEGFSIVKTREPGGSELGEAIRRLLLNRDATFAIHTKAELLLFLASRVQHLEEVIKPALNSGKVILCDRFNDSTVAYQGAGRGLGVDRVQLLCHVVCEGITPDLTFFLNVDPEVGLLRTTHTEKEDAQRGELDRIEAEKLEFHLRVHQAFLAIAEQEPQRFHVIDANQSKEAVFDTAFKIIKQQLASNQSHV
jgi:dTMP kinase